MAAASSPLLSSLRRRAASTSRPRPAPVPDPSPASSAPSSAPSSVYPESESEMFSRHKYTALPSSADRRHRRAGGLPTWKRYGLIAILGLAIVGVGYYSIGGKNDSPYNDNNTYTPNLSDDYSAPQYNDKGKQDDEEPKFKALPIEDPASFKPIYDNKPTEKPVDKPTPKPEATDKLGDGEFKEITSEPSKVKPLKPVKPVYPPDDVDPEDDMTPEPTKLVEEPPKGHPQSFEEDRDASKTTYCNQPFSPEKPLVQYALTIDAGSTGSRIHVYKFHNCGPSPQLEYETFKMLQPGLSSFAKDPTAAASSLDPLLEEANRVVPESLRKCTPVEVKATAGLRLLGEKESAAILDEVRNRLETKFPYTVSGEKAVEIMDGKDEGVYAWITANYLLGKIGEGVKTDDTLAVMDLGGASTQIVFEPKFTDTKQKLAEGDHRYELKFGGKNFVLYQHSHLNYGLMRARRSIHNLVGFTWAFQHDSKDWDSLTSSTRIPNPCLSLGTNRSVILQQPGRTDVNVTMDGTNGSFDACNRVVELVMAKDAICEVKPCSFNGVYQPSVLDTFPAGQFLALSYFTDRIQPLLSDDRDTLTVGALKKLAQTVCAGPESWKKHWGENKAAMDELEDRPEYCLDLTFMHGLLGLGYELKDERHLLVGKKIRGVELGWALGAGLALVEKAELKCTA